MPNAGMFYDTSRTSYFRVDLGGVVFEYDTSLDFLTDSNDTIHVRWVFYGDDAGFFMVPDAPPAVPVGSAPLVGPILLGTGVAVLRAKRQQPASGPEPSTGLLLASGLVGVGLRRRRVPGVAR